MNKTNNILNLVLRILAILVLLLAAFLSIATAYIIFAPNTMPKPFYLLSYVPTPPPSATTQPAIPPTPSPMPIIDTKPGDGTMVDTGSKIINLADPTGKRYIRETIVLEFAPQDALYLTMTAEQKATYITTFNSEMTPKMPIINDTIISLMSTKTFDDLYTTDGKEALRQKIKDILSTKLPQNKLISVYFTEFVID